MVLLLMAMAFGVIAFVPPVQDGDRGFGVNAIPGSLAGWAATDGAPEDALPRDPNETVSFRRTYREGDRVAWVSVALFVRQDDPKRRASLNLVHSEANAKRIEGMRVPISLKGTADTSVTLPAKVTSSPATFSWSGPALTASVALRTVNAPLFTVTV